MLAIVDKQPKILALLDIMKYFISHRQDVIRRRTRFDLKKAEARAHILEGLTIALDHLDAIIKLIRASKNVDEARTGLMERFKLSPDPGPGHSGDAAPAADPPRTRQDRPGI